MSPNFNRVQFGRKGIALAISIEDQHAVLLNDLRHFSLTFAAGFVFFSFFFG